MRDLSSPQQGIEDTGATPATATVPPTTRSVRARNRRLVLDLLRERGVLSQADVARLTGLSRTTVSTLVADLRELGLVAWAEAGRPAGAAQSGRPPVLISLDDSAGAAVGIEMGRSHIRVAVANLAHTVLAERDRELDTRDAAHAQLDAAADMVDEALAAAGVEKGQVIGVGMGLPAPVDWGRGVVASNSILPGWRGVRVADEMGERLGLPVELDNAANLGALAELLWGAGQACSDIVYVSASTGIGCGLVLDGRLYRGAHGIAGEIGHTMADEAGPVCHCGSRGCLEMLAGGPAILELLRRTHGDGLTLRGVIALAAGGDPGCQRALADAARAIGEAVATLCTLCNPERVVVGGTLSLAGELVLQPVRDAVQRSTGQFTTRVAEVVGGVLGDRAEVRGALALVLREASDHFSSRLSASLLPRSVAVPDAQAEGR